MKSGLNTQSGFLNQKCQISKAKILVKVQTTLILMLLSCNVPDNPNSSKCPLPPLPEVFKANKPGSAYS